MYKSVFSERGAAIVSLTHWERFKGHRKR